MFDPDRFMQVVYNESGSTEYVPIPEGTYPGGRVSKIGVRSVKMDGGTRDQVILDVSWLISDPQGVIKAATGRDSNTARQSIFLDLNEGGNLDMAKGKNVNLNRLREAFGQNDDGKPWTFNHLVGCSVKEIKISQKMGKNGEVFVNVDDYVPM